MKPVSLITITSCMQFQILNIPIKEKNDRDLDTQHAKFLILMINFKFIQDKEIMQRR